VTELRVLCTMLAAGRPRMVERAIRSWHSQTYRNKLLIVLDNGAPDLRLRIPSAEGIKVAVLPPAPQPLSIGELRNVAAALSVRGAMDAEVIAHWDSDDWSHPERLTEQVAFLQSSGAAAVGYREMLFWQCQEGEPARSGEAWLYFGRHPQTCIGTSLMYWRKTWAKHPFPDANTGEDMRWLMTVKAAAQTAMPIYGGNPDDRSRIWPRMIAHIHGGNTSSRIIPGAKEWQRAREWDEFCAGIMAL